MSELCGELWLETGSPFLSTGDDMTQAAEAASDLNRELEAFSFGDKVQEMKDELR